MRLSFLLIFWLSILSFRVTAQQLIDKTNPETKFYVGLGLINISHHIYYKNPTTSGEVQSGYFTPVSLNVGYKLNKRASLQIGTAYGGSKGHVESFNKDASFEDIAYKFNARTRVVAIPVTMNFILFNAAKSLPIYATATLMPAFGTTKERGTKTYKNQTTTIHSSKDAGINTFITAGLGTNFKLIEQFSAFTEVRFLKSNLNGNNSKYYDWNYESPELFKFIASIGLGINYNFK
ncbi:outer membrane beta-barrel protein [Adhaeribacter rhizoryzae]|uniref:Outer membrane beta-barrel protein n=1 Tax=Adhaeribacter rhizoryzae TaxID=2607907 RepID=A0A5M6DGW2_9BACT|nr:outer membrane beta-barrel protein [Adhaeribacter rhizoryzae]KAA5545636.1 outer membrane beta-barrel protein [Adhaeribacter rhizoryzae]